MTLLKPGNGVQTLYYPTGDMSIHTTPQAVSVDAGRLSWNHPVPTFGKLCSNPMPLTLNSSASVPHPPVLN